MKYSNGIDLFLGRAGFLQGDAGTPGKSIEMKVRQTSLMLPNTLKRLQQFVFHLPQDIEMMFEAYGIRVSWEQLMNIAGFLSPSPLHPVSKTIFAPSAVVAEGFDRQAASGRNRGPAWSQENKGNGRNPHLQRHQRGRCKSS